MADIGLVIDQDTLVLTRGRDFKWSFDNLDETGALVPFPAGDLFFEIRTGGARNTEQRVVITNANGGTFTLTYKAQTTTALDWNATAAAVQAALEALSTVGAGNVSVSKSGTTYLIEFVGAFAESPISDPITATSSLTAESGTASIATQVDQVGVDPLTIWPFVISGSRATIKIESEDADKIAARTGWQLVFVPDGEPAGGDPVGRGTTVVQL